MKEIYKKLIISSFLFSTASIADEINKSENNLAISYLYSTDLAENTATRLDSLKANAFYLYVNRWDDDASISSTWDEIPIPVNSSVYYYKYYPYLVWTQLKLAHPEKKIVLSFKTDSANKMWQQLDDDAFREKLAQNLAKRLTKSYPVYKKVKSRQEIVGQCQHNCDLNFYQLAGAVYLDGIDFHFEKSERMTEKENEGLFKLSQRVRALVGSGKLLSLTTSAVGADPVACDSASVSENCSDREDMRSSSHGEVLPLLRKAKGLFDVVNVKQYDVYQGFKYNVAMENYTRAIGTTKIIVLGTTNDIQFIKNLPLLPQSLEHNLERAAWQSTHYYGGFSLFKSTIDQMNDVLDKQIKYFNQMKDAADNAPASEKMPPSAPADLQVSTDIKAKTINLTWQLVEADAGVVSYRVYRNGVNIDTVKTTHWKDTTAQPGVKYEYYVLAVDAEGNTSSASNHVNTEIPVEESQEKPLAPSGLMVSAATQTTLDIRWQPVTNVAIGQYIVYRDGHKVQSSAALSFHDSELTANTAYLYSVVAQSVKGDLSESSAVLRAVTLEKPASQPPVVAPWENNVSYKAGDVVTFNGRQYKCLFEHRSQADWTPGADGVHLWELLP